MRLMQTTLVAAMLQSRMRPDVGQLSVSNLRLSPSQCVQRREYEPEPLLVLHYSWQQ